MNTADIYMKTQIKNILNHGYKDENPRPKYADGTPAYTLSINGNFRHYDISNNEFPITSLRPIAWKSAIKEILWIYQDKSNDLKLLNEKYNVHYWNQWESKDEPETIGQRYGAVVKNYNLMNNLLKEIETDPFGRRHIMDLYQYSDLQTTDGLYPCAFCTIWNVRRDMKTHEQYLDVTLIQRSGDLLAASCAGVNEIQYTALLMMVARHCNYKPGILYHYVANEQIYDRHIDQAKEMLHRFKQLSDDNIPQLILNPNKHNFYDFTIDDFQMINYNPIKPQLKFELGI